ncbi:MAG TPA: DUF2459 domain-containing protein [Acidiphilium sp.]
MPAPAPEVSGANLYVVGVGWHTQIYLPDTALQGGLRAFAAPHARYVGFGFAQRGFVMPKTGGAGVYIKGFFRGLAPTRGIIIVTWLKARPALAWGDRNVVGLYATPAEQARLNRVLWTDFVHPDDKPVRLEPGFYSGSAFYAAKSHYDLLFTCNSWTDSVLRAAGLPIGGGIFAGTTMEGARRLAARQAENRVQFQP